MNQLKPPLIAGDYVWDFSLPSTNGNAVSLNALVGKPLVIFFYLKDGSGDCTREVCGFRDLYEEFQKLGVFVMGIGVESEQSHRAFADEHKLPFPLLSDSKAETCANYGVLQLDTSGPQPTVALTRTTYLFGPDFRVVKAYYNVADAGHAQQVLQDAKWMLRDQPQHVIRHAPVLILPNVFPPELCRTLIELWETHNEESGFMKQVDGKTIGAADYNHKIRRDHFLADGQVQTRVQKCMADNVIPEMAKACHFSVTRREDFRIACYDASRGGYFRPHRDNTTDGTAHRRFAISVLLNEDYEGGFLRFPEYGPHLYRPLAGGGVVFSCSLLHEATDVTAGRRFVLLSFFYGETEAKMREAYARKAGQTYRA